jgi:hypothetical protein
MGNGVPKELDIPCKGALSGDEFDDRSSYVWAIDL